MGVITALAVASLAVAAIGTAESIHQGNVSESNQKKAKATSAAQSQINQQTAIREQVRAQRVKVAQISQASSNTGVTGSSGELGAVSSLGSQADSNVSNISQQGNTAASIGASLQASASAASKQATFGQIASFGAQGFSVFSATPQFKQSFNKVFGG